MKLYYTKYKCLALTFFASFTYPSTIFSNSLFFKPLPPFPPKFTKNAKTKLTSCQKAR